MGVFVFGDIMVIIYALVDPRNKDEYRYVGKTSKTLKRRLQGHIYEATSKLKKHSHRLHWLRKCENEGIKPDIICLEQVEDSLANEREIFWIAELKKNGHRLTNGTPGGEGVEYTPEVRAKISKAMSGENHPNWGKRGEGTPMYGKTHSEELKQKMREKWSGEGNPKYNKGQEIEGENNPFYGRSHTDETKEKLREQAIKRYETVPHPLKGKPLSEEHRKKLSELAIERLKGKPHPLKGRKLSAETRQKISKARMGQKHPQTHETREKIRQAKLEYWKRRKAS